MCLDKGVLTPLLLCKHPPLSQDFCANVRTDTLCPGHRRVRVWVVCLLHRYVSTRVRIVCTHVVCITSRYGAKIRTISITGRHAQPLRHAVAFCSTHGH
eukprot:6827665-Prymnesium_polylepis.1